MAASTRIISLNLGTQAVGLAEFHTQPNGGLVLNGYRLREIIGEGGADPLRNAQVIAALREMMGELRLKGGLVNFAVAGQSVFARFVKLPSVDQEKVEQLITFEAQQNVPFPMEEVVWDYQLVAGSEDGRFEVVLVAIKADLLDAINDSVQGAGLRTQLVDVAPMALYNAFRYNYSELTGCSLLIDIGARTTNLIFVEAGKVFSRSIPIGGGSITAGIAKEFEEPLALAEARKKRDGVVSLGGAYAEPSDPEVARVSKIVRNTMTRLHAEITRSISFYRAQQGGSAPQRVFLCGGSSGMPYMREFFQEKLQLTIEFFNPLRNVMVAGGVDVEEVAKSAHQLGELVGLALRRTTTCPMELNLRPASVVRDQKVAMRRPYLIFAAVCLLLGLAGWGFYYAHAAAVENAVTEGLQSRVTAMAGVEGRFKQIDAQSKATDALVAPLIGVVNDRNFWLEILEDLNARLPKENIWITELVPTSGGKPVAVGGSAAGGAPQPGTAPAPAPVAPAGPGGARANAGGPAVDGIYIRGLYLYNLPKQQEVVVDYFRNLVGSPFFAIDPNRQADVIKPTTPNETDWAFPYELRLKLRKPLPLP